MRSRGGLPPWQATVLAVAVVLLAAPLAAGAQTAEALYVRALAANCTQCHGTEGRPVEQSAVPGLAGMPREDMLRHLHAFRDGSRPATVMDRIVRGFSDAQLEQIASWFAGRRP